MLALGYVKNGKRDGYWKWYRADGSKLRTGCSGTLWTWLLPTFRGTPAALDAILRCEVPWQLVDGTLAPRALDATCPR